MIAQRIKVTSDPSVIREMAQAIVAESHPGYHEQFHKYVDLETWKIHAAQANRAWNPWTDGAIVVPVGECFDLEHIDPNAAVNWREDYGSLPSWSKIRQAYGEAEDAFEADGSFADWVDYSDVVVWAEEADPEWKVEIDAYEDGTRSSDRACRVLREGACRSLLLSQTIRLSVSDWGGVSPETARQGIQALQRGGWVRGK